MKKIMIALILFMPVPVLDAGAVIDPSPVPVKVDDGITYQIIDPATVQVIQVNHKDKATLLAERQDVQGRVDFLTNELEIQTARRDQIDQLLAQMQ